METMKIAGRRTGLLTRGAGAPAMLFHCALARAQSLDGVMSLLEEQLSMVAVDLPGHGQTEFDKTCDIHDQAVETAILLLQRNKAQAHLIGHSLGATIALRIALMRPDLVASLTLYEPVYFSLLASADRAAYDQEMLDFGAFVTAATAGDWPAAARAFLSRWSVEPFDNLPSAQQAYILQTIPLIVASERSIIAPEKGSLILNGLASLAKPVLLLRGQNSPVVTRKINKVLDTHINGSRSVVIGGAGHMGPITHVTQVGREISAFLVANQG